MTYPSKNSLEIWKRETSFYVRNTEDCFTEIEINLLKDSTDFYGIGGVFCERVSEGN